MFKVNNKDTSTTPCNFIRKDTLARMFFCEFCEISKNAFSYRTPPVAAVFSNKSF